MSVLSKPDSLYLHQVTYSYGTLRLLYRTTWAPSYAAASSLLLIAFWVTLQIFPQYEYRVS